jgi:hypothetical protein
MEAIGLNLGWDKGYLDCGFSFSSIVLQTIARMGQDSFFPNSFPVQYSPIFLPFDVM